MPTYEYQCGAGHRTRQFAGIASRQEEVPCQECGATARCGLYGDSPKTKKAPAAPPDAKDHWSHRTTWGESRCKECGHLEVWAFEGGVRPDTVECPACRHQGCMVYPVGNTVNPNWFEEMCSTNGGYYDRGLGHVVTSGRHRRELCARMGFTPVDGDVDVEGHVAKLAAKDAQTTREWKELVDRYENHPGFGEARKRRDQGRIQDWRAF